MELGLYPITYPERYRYVIEIEDYFRERLEFIRHRKVPSRTVAYAFFNNFVSKYSA